MSIMILGSLGFLSLLNTKATMSICREYKSFMVMGCILTILISIVMFTIIISHSFMRFVINMIDKLPKKYEKWKCALWSD